MMRRTFILHTEAVRDRCIEAITAMPTGAVVRLQAQPTRSLEQNARLHALCADVARHVEWRDMFNRPIRMSPERWKRFFAAMWVRAHGGASTVVPNEDGTGFYDLSVSTAEMSAAEMSHLMELIAAFGAKRGVKFGDD